jgi:hypothetical protein
VDGQDDVLGGHVAAAVGSTGAEQDDHLDELRQREVRARGGSPLGQLTQDTTLSAPCRLV